LIVSILRTIEQDLQEDQIRWSTAANISAPNPIGTARSITSCSNGSIPKIMSLLIPSVMRSGQPRCHVAGEGIEGQGGLGL